MNERTDRRLTLKHCIAYGVGDVYGGGAFVLVSTFAMYYLVAIVGMNPILAGLIPGLGKIWDAVSDPLMGYLSDHTKSRHGRRRLYFLVGIVPVFVTFALVWVPVEFSSDLGLFFYYFFAYIAFYTTSTLVLVPYGALSAEMTRDFKERNKLTGFRMFFSLFAGLLSGTLPQLIIGAMPDVRSGHLVMGLCFGALYAVPWIFVYLGTWEMPTSRAETSDEGFFANFLSIFRNRSFRVQIAMYIFAYCAMDILMAWLKFYLADYLGHPEFLTVGMGCIFITQLAALPVYIALSNRKGHAFAYRVGVFAMAMAMGFMFLQTPQSPLWALMLNCVAIGAGLSAGVIIPYQLLPFVADVDELITGKKRAGTYAGAMTLIRKLIQGALVLPTLGALLTAIGYFGPLPERFTAEQFEADIVAPASATFGGDDRYRTLMRVYTPADGAFSLSAAATAADLREARAALDDIGYKGMGSSRGQKQVPQRESTIGWIRLLFVTCPIVCLLLGFLVAFRFKVSPTNHAVLMREIARLKSGGSPSDAAQADRVVCEALTGLPYDAMAGSRRL